MGGFEQVLIGMRIELNVRVLSERFADKAQVGFWVWHRLDVALLHAEALGRVVGIGG